MNFNTFYAENLFFQQKEIYKFTWNSRGLRSVTDYFIISEKLGKHFNNVTVTSGKDIGPDHYCVRAKVAFRARRVRPSKSYSKTDLRWKINLLKEVSIIDLYYRRINQYLWKRKGMNFKK